MFDHLFPACHQYYVCASGVDFKSKKFASRKEAEAAMNKYCLVHGIVLECTECDKHERKYSDHNGCRFYINRI